MRTGDTLWTRVAAAVPRDPPARRAMRAIPTPARAPAQQVLRAQQSRSPRRSANRSSAMAALPLAAHLLGGA